MSASRETTPAGETTRDRPTLPPKVTARPACAVVAPNPDAKAPGKPSKSKIIKESQSNIKNTETALKWLADHEYVIQGEDMSVSSLTMALLYLANGRLSTPSQLVNGIRAVALCLDCYVP